MIYVYVCIYVAKDKGVTLKPKSPEGEVGNLHATMNPF